MYCIHIVYNMYVLYVHYFQFHIIWEHEFDQKLKEDALLKDVAKKIHHDEMNIPIKPREALMGGRCEPLNMWCQGEMGYVDYNSLYPYITKNCRFPVGPLQVICDNIKVSERDGRPFLDYFGIVKLKIVPMKRLRHPLLPVRLPSGRLTFPLCYHCALIKGTECDHTVEQRGWYGTYWIAEVNAALRDHYEILNCPRTGKPLISEVWNFARSVQLNRLDPTSRGLFSQYVDHFYKMKAESSGYPPSVVTEEQKDKFIADFMAHEGIRLDKSKIHHNPAMRSMTKLILNQNWGW